MRSSSLLTSEAVGVMGRGVLPSQMGERGSFGPGGGSRERWPGECLLVWVWLASCEVRAGPPQSRVGVPWPREAPALNGKRCPTTRLLLGFDHHQRLVGNDHGRALAAWRAGRCRFGHVFGLPRLDLVGARFDHHQLTTLVRCRCGGCLRH